MENINKIIEDCKNFFKRSYIKKTNFEKDLLNLLEEEIILFEEYKQITKNKELWKHLLQY
jgi:predicted house-cleaning noncanonical NTP pyrophosphatase (MazG superfamily)